MAGVGGLWGEGPKGRQELDNGLRSHSLLTLQVSVAGKLSFLSQGNVKNVHSLARTVPVKDVIIVSPL